MLELVNLVGFHMNTTEGVLEPVTRTVLVLEEIVRGVAVRTRIGYDPAGAESCVDFVEKGRHFK